MCTDADYGNYNQYSLAWEFCYAGRVTTTLTARSGAAGQPLAGARGSDKSHDREGGVRSKSKYLRIADDLAQQITRGVLRSGDRVPSLRELSRRNRVSMSTALQAY